MKYGFLLLLACTTAFAAERQAPSALQMLENGMEYAMGTVRQIEDSGRKGIDYTIGCGCCESDMIDYLECEKDPARADICGCICWRYFKEIEGPLHPLLQVAADGVLGVLACDVCPPPIEYVLGCAAASAVAIKLLDRKLTQLRRDPEIKKKLQMRAQRAAQYRLEEIERQKFRDFADQKKREEREAKERELRQQFEQEKARVQQGVQDIRTQIAQAFDQEKKDN